ncbi:MAG TPA: aspartyl protease family protein [Bryobacteraceae bacterium]|nr:aspartyl protease family protein [Bryobacteraceae bacterium]
MEAAGAKKTQQKVAVLSVHHIAAQTGCATEGILSVAAFSLRAVEVDYARKRLRVLDRAELKIGDGAAAIPIAVKDGVPYAPVEIPLANGPVISGRFLIDSGWSGAILFSSPFLREHPELLEGERKDLAPVDVVGGKMATKFGRIPSFRLGPFTFKEPMAVFTINGAGILNTPGVGGLIGAALLKRFHVIYDYAAQRMLLTTGSSLNDPL